MKKLKGNNGENGQVLPLVLIVLFLGAALIAPALAYNTTTLKVTQSDKVRMDRLYAADAGIKTAIWQLEQSPPNTSPINLNLNTEGVAVTITPQPDGTTYKITSTSANSTITAYVTRTSTGQALFSNALSTGLGGDITLNGASVIKSDGSGGGDVFSGGNLTLTGSSSITGNVYARSDVNLSSSTKIIGDASASGTVGTSGTVTGAKTSGATPETPNSLSDSYLNSTVQGIYNETFNIGTITPGGTTYNSGLTIANNKANGTAIAGGHITGPIYVVGDLIFQNVNTVTFDSQVYVTGNINFKSGTQNLTFAGPVYAGGQITTGSGAGIITFQSTTTANGGMNLGASYTFVFNGAVKDLGSFTVGNSASTSFSNTIYVGGNFNYGGAGNLNMSHDIYIKGALTLTNSAQIVGPEKVVVRGNVSISGAGSLTGTSQLPFIIVPPAATTPALSPMTDPISLTITGSGTASAVFYAPTTALTSSGSGSLFGAAITQTVTLNNSAQVIYPSNLTTRSDLPSNGGGLAGGPGSINTINWNFLTGG